MSFGLRHSEVDGKAVAYPDSQAPGFMEGFPSPSGGGGSLFESFHIEAK